MKNQSNIVLNLMNVEERPYLKDLDYVNEIE
jgi:hypothetical protein